MEKLLEEFLNTHLYKLIIGIGLAYAGVLLSMGIDLIYGVKKAKELKIVRTSTGYKKTAAKAQKYLSPMLCLTIVDIMLSVCIPLPVFTLLWAAYCAFCEFKSIREKSWQKAELREAANTMNVVIKNKDDIAKIVAELLYKDNNKEEQNK